MKCPTFLMIREKVFSIRKTSMRKQKSLGGQLLQRSHQLLQDCLRFPTITQIRQMKDILLLSAFPRSLFSSWAMLLFLYMLFSSSGTSDWRFVRKEVEMSLLCVWEDIVSSAVIVTTVLTSSFIGLVMCSCLADTQPEAAKVVGQCVTWSLSRRGESFKLCREDNFDLVVKKSRCHMTLTSGSTQFSLMNPDIFSGAQMESE